MMAPKNKNIQSADMMIISLRFFMNENLMMTIPELMKIIDSNGAMLE